MAKKLVGIRLSDEVRYAIKAAQRWGCEPEHECSQAEAIGILITTGIRPLLIQQGIEPKSIFEGVEAACRAFYSLADALLNGNKSCYYIATYPKGGYWEKEGYTGKAILHRAMTLTKDGINTSNAKAKEFPEIPDWLKDDIE